MPFRNPEDRKAYRRANRERARNALTAWRASNPDRQRAIEERQRAKASTNARKTAWRVATGYTDVQARKGRVRKHTPSWADMPRIRSVYAVARAYRVAGLDVHVDHEIPLAGRLVSGLHVHHNLTIRLAVENLRKGNRA